MNSSCGGTSIGDTCMVFCAERYQADIIASLRVDFSKCFSLNYNETCVVRCSVGHPGVDDKNTPGFISDSDVYLKGSLECAEESANCPPSERWPTACCLATITSSRQTVTCQELQVQTTAACSLWRKGRVGQPSKEVADKTILQHQVAGVSCQLRSCSRAESKSKRFGISQQHECVVSK